MGPNLSLLLRASIFDKYSSSFEIMDPAEMERNLQISNRLLYYAYNHGVLSSSTDGKLDFDYTDECGQLWSYHFPDQTAFDRWLDNKSEIDIWEIDDRRSGESTLTYKLKRQQQWGHEDFSSDQALFEAIVEEAGGIWKLAHMGEHKELFIYARWDSWSGKYTFEDRNLEDLSFISGLEEFSGLNEPVKEEREPLNEKHNPLTFKTALKVTLLTGLAVLAGCKFANSTQHAMPNILVSAFAAHTVAMKGLSPTHASALTLGYAFFSGFSSPAAAQVVTSTSSYNINVYTGQSVNFSLPQFFTDQNGYTLRYSAAPLPNFLAYNPVPARFNSSINSKDNLAGSAVVGNILHIFGGQFPVYETFNTILSPPQGLDSFSLGNGYFDGRVFANFTHLAAGPNGHQIVNSKFPSALSSAATVPANTTVQHIDIDQARSIAWTGDGRFLFSTNVTDPFNPVRLGSFQETQPITGLSVDGNLVYVISGPTGGLRIVDGTIPSTPSSKGFLSLSGTPTSISCIKKTCSVAQGPLGFRFYNMNGTNPVDMGGYTPSNGENYNSTRFNGPLLVTDSNHGTVNLFDPTNPANATRYSSFNVTQTPYSVFPLGNRFFVSTNNGTLIYDVNQDGVSGIPGPSDRGTHTFNLTASDFNGGNASVQVIVNVMDQSPTVANALEQLTATVGQTFTYVLPSNTFFDPDDPVTSLVISLIGLGFATYNSATRTIQGVPS